MIKLETEGDQFEKDFWPLFIKDQFPSYEKFWQKFVFPLRQEGSIHFQSGTESLHKIKQNHLIAQLNYVTIRHLIRCFEILLLLEKTFDLAQYDLFVEYLARIVGALDNGDELLARQKWSSDYTGEQADKIRKEGEKAREAWREEIGDPLKKIRFYRNRVMHCSPPPVVTWQEYYQIVCLPDIGKESSYLDFRLITNSSSENFEEHKKDFIPVHRIAKQMWNEVIDYLENNWKNL